MRPFVFAPIALTDDVNAATKNEDVLKGLGTIRIDFYRTVYQGQVASAASYADDIASHVRTAIATRRAIQRKANSASPGD